MDCTLVGDFVTMVLTLRDGGASYRELVDQIPLSEYYQQLKDLLAIVYAIPQVDPELAGDLIEMECRHDPL